MPLILHGILTPNRKQLALGVCEEVSSGTWDNNKKKKNTCSAQVPGMKQSNCLPAASAQPPTHLNHLYFTINS